MIEPRYLTTTESEKYAIGPVQMDIPEVKIEDGDKWIVSVMKESLSEYEIAVVRKKYYHEESWGGHRRGQKYVIAHSSCGDWRKYPLPKNVFLMLVESAQQIANELNAEQLDKLHEKVRSMK